MRSIWLIMAVFLAPSSYAGAELNVNVGLSSNAQVIWPSLGLSATGNIGRFFALGGSANSYFSFATSNIVNTTTIFVDVDFLVKPMVPVPLNAGRLAVYLAMYAGPTAVVELATNSRSTQFSTYIGWNIAAMPGVQYDFESGVGLHAEIGALYRDWYTGSPTIHGATNLGVSYAF